MEDQVEISVAHYGHPKLRGIRHWAIVVMTAPHKLEGVLYELVGGAAKDLVLGEVRAVELLKSSTYLGRQRVGVIPARRMGAVHDILVRTPLRNGTTGWNCQSWVVEALARIIHEGSFVDSRRLSVGELQGMLAVAAREDGL